MAESSDTGMTGKVVPRLTNWRYTQICTKLRITVSNLLFI